MTAILTTDQSRRQFIISPTSRESIGIPLIALAGNNPTSAAWPSTNRAIYIPFSLPYTASLRKLVWFNGATASGNGDMGVFTSVDGKPAALLVSTGSVVQSGTDAPQATDITDLWLPPGAYYMGLAHSNGTGTYYRYGVPSAILMTFIGVCQASTAFPLAANPTIAALATVYLPHIGLLFDAGAVL